MPFASLGIGFLPTTCFSPALRINPPDASSLTDATAKSFFFSSRRRHRSSIGDWSSDVCSSDLWRLASRTACVQAWYSRFTSSMGSAVITLLSRYASWLLLYIILLPRKPYRRSLTLLYSTWIPHPPGASETPHRAGRLPRHAAPARKKARANPQLGPGAPNSRRAQFDRRANQMRRVRPSQSPMAH